MSRGAAQTAAAYIGALVLVAATVATYIARRPPYFQQPRTLVDHVSPVATFEHETRGIQLLAPQVEPLLPRGAEVTAFRPKDGQSWNDNGVYLAAVGLLPRQFVLPPWTALGDEPVEYVIAVGEPFTNPLYAPVAGFPNGWLYHRR